MARTFRRTEEQMQRSVRGLGATRDESAGEPVTAAAAFTPAPEEFPPVSAPPVSAPPVEQAVPVPPAPRRSRFRDSRRKPVVERVSVERVTPPAAELISEPVSEAPAAESGTFLERLATVDEPSYAMDKDATVQLQKVEPSDTDALLPDTPGLETEVAALEAAAVLETEVAALEAAEEDLVEVSQTAAEPEEVSPTPDAGQAGINPHVFQRRHIEIGTAAALEDEETALIPVVASREAAVSQDEESTQDPAAGESLAAVAALEAVKIYGEGANAVTAVDGVSHEFPKGRFTAIMGPSGSGKSTLLHCLAGLDDLSSGRVTVGRVNVTGLDEKGKTLLRRDKVGFIFQSFNLVPTLTAMENIVLPMELAKREPDMSWVNYLVATVGLSDRLDHLPSELSGGQQQRVAAVRALAGKPEIVFADEPTGNLDSRRSGEILEFLRKAVDEFGQTIVMVTHDPIAASYADSVVFLADGKIVEEISTPSVGQILDRIKNLPA